MVTGSFPYTNPSTSQQLPHSNPYLCQSNRLKHLQTESSSQQPTPHQTQVSSSPPQPQLRYDASHGSRVSKILRALIRDPFQDDLFLSLRDAFPDKSSSFQWNSSDVIMLAQWIGLALVEITDSDRDHKMCRERHPFCVSALALLTRCMQEHWSDEQVYAALLTPIETTGETASMTLLQVMDEAWTYLDAQGHGNVDIAVALLVAWMTGLSCRHRLLHTYLQSPCEVVAPTPTAVQFSFSLLADESDFGKLSQEGWSHPLLCVESVCWACLEALRLHMAAHDLDRFDDLDDLPQASVDRIVQKLQKWSSTLASSDGDRMNPNQVRLALLSLQFLLNMRQANKNSAEQIISCLVKAFFIEPFMPQQESRACWTRCEWLTCCERVSSWAHAMIADVVRLDTVHDISVESVVRTLVDHSSEWIVTTCVDTISESDMASLILLLRHYPVLVRSRFRQAALTQGDLIAKLLHRTCETSSLQSAILLQTLLQARQSITTHDELSRTVWNSVDSAFAERCFDAALLVQSSKRALGHPIAWSLLETLVAILTCEYELARSLLMSTSAQAVESLVDLMCPSTPSSETSICGTSFEVSLSQVWKDDTPTVNNLSRIDDFDKSQRPVLTESKCSPFRYQGLEPALSMASATLSACLAWYSSEALGQRCITLQNRMMETVNQYLEQLFQQRADIIVHQTLPRSSISRSLMLLKVMTNAENIDFLATLIHTRDFMQYQAICALKDDCQRHEATINAYAASEKCLRLENATLKQRLAKQSLSQRRRLDQHKTAMDQNAKQLVEIHRAERMNAENLAQELRSQLCEVEEQLRAEKEAIHVSKEVEAELRLELMDVRKKLEQCERNEKLATQRAEANAAKVLDLSREMQVARTAADAHVQNERQMTHALEIQRELIVQLEESENEMRESIESLFADLINLSKLYELNELDTLSHQKTIETLARVEKELDSERVRSADLHERCKMVEADNDHLRRKYDRVREKLEQERQERMREKEAPVKLSDSHRVEGFPYFSHINRPKKAIQPRHRNAILRSRDNES